MTGIMLVVAQPKDTPKLCLKTSVLVEEWWLFSPTTIVHRGTARDEEARVASQGDEHEQGECF